MVSTIKEILVGTPIATAEAHHQRISKKIALAVFSSDALSSVAYATEEILLVLAVVVAFNQGNLSAFRYVIPISLGIAALLVIVALSYRQTIYAYPSGGGAYIVAKENLGTMSGLTAGAALLIDYILTVSVSIASGVAALTSMVQGTKYAWLGDHSVLLCILFIWLLTIANLRGVKESGKIFSLPTYIFIISFVIMIVWGLVRYKLYGAPPAKIELESLALAKGYAPHTLSIMILLGAFSNGCTALTGVEAISNGVPAFKKPESHNAVITLLWMATILILLFIGTSALAFLYQVGPKESETIISQFARIIFNGPAFFFYYVVQIATALILILAANTSFADFPRLASLLARDSFLPRQLANQGDRLVFSNGIIFLALLSSLLIVVFEGNTNSLIPLYAVGVFLSFTLSQSGMVVHWWRARKHAPIDTPEHPATDWYKGLVINALGAVATFVVLVVFIITKFMHGAWIVVVAIPLFVMMFRAIHKHYALVAKQLKITMPVNLEHCGQTVIVPVSGVHNAVLAALEYAGSISTDVRAIYVGVDQKLIEAIQEDWKTYKLEVPLIILDSPYRSLITPLLQYIKQLTDTSNNLVTIVLPEFIPAKWWHHMLHNQSSLLIKGALLFNRHTVVTSVPFHLKE